MRTKQARWVSCLVLALVCAGGLAPNAGAATTYTWDSNPATSAIDNGAGTWNTINTNWDLSGIKYAWPNSLSDTAVFGLGGTIGGTRFVTVDAGGVNVSNITFNYTDAGALYVLQTGPITLADGGTIKQIGGSAALPAAIISIIHGGAVNIGDGISNGVVRFVVANDYNGVTTIKSGAELRVEDASALGLASAGTVVESGGSLSIRGSSDLTIASEPLTLNGTGVNGIGALNAPASSNPRAYYNGPITLGSDARINSNGNNLFLAIGGPITGAFNLTLGGIFVMAVSSINTTGSVTFDGTGGSALVALATANTFTGGLIFKGNNASAYVRVDNVLSLGPADKATVTFGPGAAGYIGLNSVSPTIVGLNTDATTPGTPVIKNTGTAKTLTVNNATANTFAGSLQDGSGALSLIKGAAGTLTLSGDNSYTGTKTINAGMLVAAHSNALGTAGTITVTNNGTLLGVAAGVTLTRNVTFNPGSGLAIYFTDVGAGSAGKLVAGTTTLSLTGKTLKLKGTIKPGSYVVASFQAITSGTTFTVDTSELTGSATVSYPGDGTVVVTASPKGTVITVQ